MIKYIINLFWRFVFFWKKRTGWLDTNQFITIRGTVIELVPPDIDGDRAFNVKLDPGFEKYITLGDRLTSENPDVGPNLHCEIPPWSAQLLLDRFDMLRVGDRIQVSGIWGYDGVHINNWPTLIQLPLALVRHQPDMKNGWFEIHPVINLQVI